MNFLRNFLTQLLTNCISTLIVAGILSGAILTLVSKLKPLRDLAFSPVSVPLYSILLVIVVICIFLLLRSWVRRLKIRSANYGYGAFQANVTNRVEAHVHRGVLDVLATTAELCGGIDPAPGHTKALTVNYRLNGQDRTIQVIEGSRLILP